MVQPFCRNEDMKSGELVDVVLGIRVASRTLVRELGFLNRHLAGTELTASQVHALLELETQPDIRAAELKHVLRLDKSATSRLLDNLTQRGYLAKRPSATDARAREFQVTTKGTALLQTIHKRTSQQIVRALEALSDSERHLVLDGLSLYAKALKSLRYDPARSRRD